MGEDAHIAGSSTKKQQTNNVINRGSETVVENSINVCTLAAIGGLQKNFFTNPERDPIKKGQREYFSVEVFDFKWQFKLIDDQEHFESFSFLFLCFNAIQCKLQSNKR